MIYTICIANSYLSPAPFTALKFAKALIKKQHQIKKIFFYTNGVYNTSSLIVGSKKQQIILQQWQDFITKHDIIAEVCVSAALKRGIIDKTEANINKISSHNLKTRYKLAGITQWLRAIAESDRHLIFG